MYHAHGHENTHGNVFTQMIPLADHVMVGGSFTYLLTYFF